MLWLVGILLFSGSLYLMSAADLSLGWVVPVGGMALLVGWAVLFIMLWRQEAAKGKS